MYRPLAVGPAVRGEGGLRVLLAARAAPRGRAAPADARARAGMRRGGVGVARSSNLHKKHQAREVAF